MGLGKDQRVGGVSIIVSQEVVLVHSVKDNTHIDKNNKMKTVVKDLVTAKSNQSLTDQATQGVGTV